MFKQFYLKLVAFGNMLQSILLLAMRIYWGGSFFITGWAKLHNISPIIDYFGTLNIPLPAFNAYVSSSIEFACGFCLLIGLASRLVSIPLIIVMIVALFTAHHEALMNGWNDPQNLIAQLPFNYLLTALIVLAFGPGKISVDFLIQKYILRHSKEI